MPRLQPGLMRFLCCHNCLRLTIFLCLSLACGHLLRLRHHFVDDHSTAVPVAIRAGRTTTREVETTQPKVVQVVQTPITLLPTEPPPFSHYPDFPFRYLINEPHLCKDDVFIINMIGSATANFATRQIIRAMWGNKAMAEVTNTGMRTVFVLGVSTAGQEGQRLIEEESHAYHDIIQVDFMDTYLNLTLKTLTMLHWTLTHCPNAAWLLKSDDDVFVNPYALKSLLVRSKGASFVCEILKTPRVCRSVPKCPPKWIVSRDEYKYNRYPSYCNGPAYSVSVDMVKKLYAAANKTHPFFIEDIYFTGILPLALKAQYVNVRPRYMKVKPRILEKFWNGKIVFTLFTDRVRIAASNVLFLWHKIVDYNNLTRLLVSL